MAARLTQREVAEHLRVHEMTVSRWERGPAKGGTAPNDDELRRLAELYRTTPAALRYGANGETQPMVRERQTHMYGVAAGLPKRVRVWIQSFLLELAEADVPDEQIDATRRMLVAPESFEFYVGGPDQTEDEMIDSLEIHARHIRDVLRQRGFKVKAR